MAAENQSTRTPVTHLEADTNPHTVQPLLGVVASSETPATNPFLLDATLKTIIQYMSVIDIIKCIVNLSKWHRRLLLTGPYSFLIMVKLAQRHFGSLPLQWRKDTKGNTGLHVIRDLYKDFLHTTGSLGNLVDEVLKYDQTGCLMGFFYDGFAKRVQPSINETSAVTYCTSPPLILGMHIFQNHHIGQTVPLTRKDWKIPR